MRPKTLLIVFLVIALVFDVTGSIIAMSTAGGGGASSCPSSPVSPCWTQVQTGTFQCTINNGAFTCSKTVTFSPAYSVKPRVWDILNATCGTNCQYAATISTSFSNVPFNGPALTFQTASTTWIVPVAYTELNGANAQEVAWQIPTGFISNVLGNILFCVDFQTLTGTETFKVQRSTDLVTWADIGRNNDGVPISSNPFSTGPICGTEALGDNEYVAGTIYYFRVMGSDSAGPIADTQGAISLQITGVHTFSTNTPISCSATYSALSTASATFNAVCGLLPGINNGPRTFTLNWWAGVPA